MAKRRRKRATTTRRRRQSTARRRSPVRATRRRRSHSTAVAPRRHRRRRGYRRNPPTGSIFRQAKQGLMDAGATLAGGAVARVVGGFVPLPNTGLTGVAVGLGVAIGVGMLSRKVVGADTARFITAGAMQVPLKNLVTTFVPGAGAYLGDYDNVGAYEISDGRVGDYLNPGDSEGAEEESIGAYD
jgi:hypothetical protein